MKVIANLSHDFLFPFQILIDIVTQLAPDALDRFSALAIAPICELNSINDWINLESLGKPAAVRAHALIEQLNKIFNQKNIQTIDLHIYTLKNNLKNKLTSDNEYSLLFLSKLIKLNIFYYQEKIESNITHWKGKDLIAYAWMGLKAGADEIGCHVIEKVLADMPKEDPSFEILFMHLQLIRFLAHRYLLVTDTFFPENFNFLNSEEINNLYFIKAYAATLCRNISVAEIYFNKCDIHFDMKMTDEKSLYRLNNYALLLVLQNNLEKALDLEIKIKNFIEQHSIDIVGLKYVNFINIARLYKKLKQFDQSLLYYEKAYTEIEGAYTLSDNIYYHINLGSLYEAAGNIEKAIHHWVKASIYWQFMDNPQALSWRPRLILCQEKMADILSPLSIEKINQFFYDKIQVLFKKSNKTFDLSININKNIDQIYLSDNITSINTIKDGLEVKYKRSFLNKKLINQNEINLIKKLRDEKILPFNKLSEIDQEALNSLINKKVILKKEA